MKERVFFLVIAGCASVFFACNTANNTTPESTVAVASVRPDSTTERGKSLFFGKCSSCHFVNKEMTGPALRGVSNRWPDKALLYAFIRNSEAVIAVDAYARKLYLEYNQTAMNKHDDLSDADIAAILNYIESVSVAP